MTETKKSGGVSFLGLMTLLFIGLKLGNVISWGWFWVLAPTLIPAGIGLAFFIIFGIVLAFMPKVKLKNMEINLKKLNKKLR